jgi:hypothetical protein
MVTDPTHPSGSALRERMIEDMNVRGFTEDTRRDYIRCVRRFAVFLGRSGAGCAQSAAADVSAPGLCPLRKAAAATVSVAGDPRPRRNASSRPLLIGNHFIKSTRTAISNPQVSSLEASERRPQSHVIAVEDRHP